MPKTNKKMNAEQSAQPQTHRFNAEVAKVLKIMIHSLYTNQDIFLRELISNASDACEKLRYAAITQPDLVESGVNYEIHIHADPAARTLTIEDNGVGMNEEELIANLGTIARSGTQEFMTQLTGDASKDAALIGQFGVGFYSSFMVAQKVEVVSRKAGEPNAFRWESEGEGEFTLQPMQGQVARGTRITLHLQTGKDEYLDFFRLKHIVQTYSDHIAFPITLHHPEHKAEAINAASALWSRAKNEITPEQYQEFYRHVAHSPDAPWMTFHHKAEGLVEYTALLFVPSIKPFDLFHPDRMRRVKLYVKRVYITDEKVELIPSYLRFLRGIVDSQDLPLNISRETLQANPIITKIRDSITKKLLSDLKKQAEKDAVSYASFWANFGAVLKEGLCEATAPREAILEVCRFDSCAQDGATSLDDYIARMQPGQEEIFYLSGENAEQLRHNPRLAGFTQRGIEVLLFSDHVDDFWTNVTLEFKGKRFKSITRSDIDLSQFAKKEGEKADEKPESQADISALSARVRQVLGDAVKDVRATEKLGDIPACLSVEEGGMDIRLERFLVEQKQLPAVGAKVLEINAAHPVMQSLQRLMADEAQVSKAEDIIWLVFDQAKILEGEPVSDPAEFARRLNGLMA